MRVRAGWLWLLLIPSIAAGQVPSADKTPEPAPLEAPAPRVLPAEQRPPSIDGSCRTPGFGLPICSVAELKDNFVKLKAEREALQSERLAFAQKPLQDTSLSEENVKLRLRLSEILSRLTTRNEQARAPVSPSLSENTAKPPPGSSGASAAENLVPPAPAGNGAIATPDATRPLDPLALAHVLFRAGKYEASLRAYRLIDLRGMKAEERLPIQYLIATCLKRAGKAEEAKSIYRDIANSRGDENVALCAQWQLGAFRWEEEMRAQLDTLRQRRKALENRP